MAALWMKGVILYCVFLTSLRFVQGNAPFSAQILSNGMYKIVHRGSNWMDFGGYMFQADGKRWSLMDGTLKPVTSPSDSNGTDKLGTWNMVNFTWAVGTKRVDTTFKMYHRTDDTGLQFIVFSQHFRDGLEGTSVNDANKVASAFPSFYIQDGLGALVYANLMSGWVNLDITKWSQNRTRIHDGLEWGPIAFFDKTGATMVISPFSHFMAANTFHNTTNHTLNYGVMGSIDSIPPGYTMDTIIYYSDHGINDAMEGWGRVLRTYYDKDWELIHEDPTIKYLGFWTDNGAYYYHHTEEGKNYEQTILDQFDYSISNGIPYRYVQYDDWWYYYTKQEGYGGTLKWEPMPTVFPDGLKYMYNKTKWPVHAHNRWWSSETVYAKQNGGQFDFVISDNYSLPIQQEFWDYLFNQAVQWGLVVYEQDWLNTQMNKVKQLQTDLFLGEKWLKQMGEAASRVGINVQYCMALPREVMTALEIPAVTQARVSGDYAGATQWKIGISSMFSHAVGVAPFKDNFWTITNQTGNPSYKNKIEPNPEMQAVIALLSMGPVGPSDSVGHSNVTLIKKTCRSDGLLLKPSKPATAIDHQIMQQAFGGDIGPVGEVWTTYSKIGDYYMGIVFSAEIKKTFHLKPRHTGFEKLHGKNRPILTFSHDGVEGNVMPTLFHEYAPLQLSPGGIIPWNLTFTVTPIQIKMGTVALLGEMSKIVPQSPQRILSVSVSTDDVIVAMVGAAGEHVDFSVYYQELQMIKQIPCDFPDTLSVTLSVANMNCQ